MSFETNTLFEPWPHTAGSMYGRVIVAEAGIVVAGGAELVGAAVVDVVGTSVVEGCRTTEVAGGVLGVARWTSEQAAAAIARAASPAIDRRLLMHEACSLSAIVVQRPNARLARSCPTPERQVWAGQLSSF